MKFSRRRIGERQSSGNSGFFKPNFRLPNKSRGFDFWTVGARVASTGVNLDSANAILNAVVVSKNLEWCSRFAGRDRCAA